MIKGKIIKRKESYFSTYNTPAEVVVMNYDTALMAFSSEEGGELVCYDLSGKNQICGLELLISERLKIQEIIVGGQELREEYPK